MMALETGARVSDLLLLNWGNISIEHKDVEYLNKKSKKKQIQLLSDNTINSLLTYKEVVGGANLGMGLFYNDKKGSVMSRITANRRTQKEFGFNFHELRKEAGKNVANQKGVVYASKYLGHSRVSTTDIYLGVSANTYREQMKDVKI
jgi:integrase